MAKLREQEFSKHVGSQFKIIFSDGELSLTLVESKPYMPQENEQGGMERFSVLFEGPPSLMLPQRTYPMLHEKMGEFEIFITPVSQDQNGVRYEAVFNYFKSSDE